MKEYIFSDYVFLKTVKELLTHNEEDISAREKLIRMLDKRIADVDRANGLWRLPDQRKNLISCCTSMREMLSVHLSLKAIHGWLTWVLEENEKKTPKCKVLFVAQEFAVWPSLESIYLAMQDDERFDPEIVFVPFYHQNKEPDFSEIVQYERCGLKIWKYSEYDVAAHCPDIVFYSKPYDENIPHGFRSTEIERIVDRMVYVPYGMEISRKLFRYGYHAYLHYKAWKHIAYGDIVYQIGKVHGFKNGENIAVWGHPKADIYREEQVYDVPRAWKDKISGRKVLLWCPHHTIKPGSEKVSTWIEFSKTVFKAIEKHPEIVLLMRPHPLLFGALVNEGIMTRDELDTLIAEKTACSNIILDDTEDYRAAAFVSDGMITDGTTFAIEYLYSGKPYMVTTFDMSSFYSPEKMEAALYIGKDEKAVEEFIDMFARGEDPKREKRIGFRNQEFFWPKDQTVGAYIADHVISSLVAEEQARSAGKK